MSAPNFRVGHFRLVLIDRKKWSVAIGDNLCVAELKTLVFSGQYKIEDEEEWQITLDGKMIAHGENLFKLLVSARKVLTRSEMCDIVQSEGRIE